MKKPKKVNGNTSEVLIHPQLVFKRQTKFLEFDLLGNEFEKLAKLTKYNHFPNVKNYNGVVLSMENVGVELVKKNIPEDFYEQLNDILFVLRKEEILHRDIRPENLLVRGGVITLIDFGWALFKDEKPFGPDSIGDRFRMGTGKWDDEFSILKTAKYLKCLLQG